MEIHELNFIAFGPFSDRLLEFSSDGGGLHIVYGPNEAGKSSSLRGLKSLLFGIPSRTTDNFIHNNKDLRIAGRLLGDNGQILDIVRRKGNKNTLSSPNGDQLDDAILLPFMRGVSTEIFETLFGIDHEGLILGGQEILEQKGEVGQALFAASIGSASLHSVLEQLESEADALFKPRGSTQDINAGLKKYADLQKSIKERSLSSKEWADKYQALEKTNGDLAEVQSELAQHRAECNRLKRIQRALPKIVERRDMVEQLEVLGSAAILSEDFDKRREETSLELENAKTTLTGANANIGGLQEQLAGISINSAVLEAGEIIEDLHSQLGGHRKAMQDRPQLKAQRKQLLNDAEASLKNVDPVLSLEDSETLRPVLSKRARITELGAERQAHTQRVIQAKKAIQIIETRLKRAQTLIEKLQTQQSTESLSKRVKGARKLGDLDGTIQSSQETIERLEKSCLDQLSRQLDTWPGSLDGISTLSLPIGETIDRFEQDYFALEQRMQKLDEKQEEHATSLRQASRQLEEIQHSGSVPTEEDLVDIRSVREQAWTLLRRQWLDGDTVEAEAKKIDPDRALPEAYEARVTDADEIADRLRREAERVQKKAGLLASCADSETSIASGHTARSSMENERQQLDADWVRLWKTSDIKPLPPREMRAWLEDMAKLRDRADELETQQSHIKKLDENRELQIHGLHEELKKIGSVPPQTQVLDELLDECEVVVNRLDNLSSEYQTLSQTIDSLEEDQDTAQQELHDAKESLKEWKDSWQKAVVEMGLGADALPAEASGMLDNISNLFSKLTEADGLKIRLDGIDEDSNDFSKDVARVVERAAPESDQLPSEEVVTHLIHLLKDTRTERARQAQLESQVRRGQENITTAEAAKKTMEGRLAALCREAQCNDATGLQKAVLESTAFKSLNQGLTELNQELCEIGEGLSLTHLEAEADTADPDTLPAEIEALNTRIDAELEPQQADLNIDKGALQKELSLMDGSDEAATLAIEAQSALEEIRSNAENYVQRKLASRILRDEIERYRQQNQGPLLERASEHFAVLTRGSFAGLQTDFNEKDDPVLVGVRADETRVFVDGMSSGTRDQLYLALRLASLEKYIESSERMPFIVDDILVHFDDDRSEATLGVLADLSKKTQIIMFTHHQRLVEQAHALSGTAQVTVHVL